MARGAVEGAVEREETDGIRNAGGRLLALPGAPPPGVEKAIDAPPRDPSDISGCVPFAEVDVMDVVDVSPVDIVCTPQDGGWRRMGVRRNG